MTSIVPIVEGHGEERAVQLLIRRIVEQYANRAWVDVRRPIRRPRGTLLDAAGMGASIELAVRRNPGCRVLVLLDADRACPVDVAQRIGAHAAAARPDVTTRVVVATCEYEAWLIAAVRSLAGRAGLPLEPLEPPGDPETIRDAKGWLRAHMPDGRRNVETIDQEKLTAVMDLDLARTARSFDKSCREVMSLVSQGDGRVVTSSSVDDQP